MSLYDRVALIGTFPTTEPIALDEVKVWLRIDGTADDTALQRLIAVAREGVEQMTRRALITRTLRLSLDLPPDGAGEWWAGVRDGALASIFGGGRIALPYPPLVSVQSITAYDDADAGVVWSATNYYVDASTQDAPGRIVPRIGAVWPMVQRLANGLVIDYTAGYGVAATSVPAQLRQALLRLVAYLYQNRGDFDVPAAAAAAGLQPILNRYTVYRL